MTGMLDHAFGCRCRRHVDRAWNRPEHWTAAEIAYLEAGFGLRSDAAIAKRLGRSVVGLRLKAKRLGLRKHDHGLTAGGVAEIFGIDPGTVSKVWIRRGLLRARRGYLQGPTRVWVVQEREVERFIRDHGQYVDVDNMPDSIYRDLAEQHRFYSLPEVVRLTGRHPHALSLALRRGIYRGAKRGTHWYVPAGELPRIASRGHLGPASRERISRVRRKLDQELELRRNRRKGVAA